MPRPEAIPGAPDNDQHSILAALMATDRKMLLDRVDSLFRFSDTSMSFIDRFVDLIQQGHVPVIYANHQSYADGMALSQITKYIMGKGLSGRLNGFLLPVAKSIETGDQGSEIQVITTMFTQVTTERGLLSVPIIRDKDKEEYGLEGSNTESYARLSNALEDGYGLAIFPEGTMEGGRKDTDGRIKGMQQVSRSLLAGRLKVWLRKGRTSVVLPVGIHGGYRIQHPDEKGKVSEDVLEMVAEDCPVKSRVTITVGKPFIPDAAVNDDSLMRRVAQLLPPEARGYYRER